MSDTENNTTPARGFTPRFQEFRVGPQADWRQYARRLGYYFVSAGITSAEQKKATLFTVCGEECFNLITNLARPRDVDDLSYDEVIQLATDHFHKKPSAIVSRFRFYKRDQKPEESLSNYIAELRTLSEYCEFTDLEVQLRDRLVCGTLNEKLQKDLLEADNLDFAKALKMSQAAEVAAKSCKELRGSATSTAAIDYQGKQHTQQRQVVTERSDMSKQCGGCGGSHARSACPHKQAECFKCHKTGHISSVCRSAGSHSAGGGRHNRSFSRGFSSADKPNSAPIATDVVEVENLYPVCVNSPPVHSTSASVVPPPFNVTVKINQRDVNMVVDTGAGVTVMSEQQFNELWPEYRRPTLRASSVALHVYGGRSLSVVGVCDVSVATDNSSARLELHILRENGPALMGRNWLVPLQLRVAQMLYAVDNTSIPLQLQHLQKLFSGDLGCYQGPPVSLQLSPNAAPKFMRPRPVPYALREKIEAELDRLVQQGSLVQTTQSRWATPVVPVLKASGEIRLCGDYKCTVNPVLDVDQYPLPKPEDIFAGLAGGVMYTKLDLAQAYTQVPMTPESQEMCTINTHRGLYRPTRLCFGVAASPARFQQVIDDVIRGIPGVVAYIDDILITGSTEEQHWE